jgi:hypothetical protein
LISEEEYEKIATQKYLTGRQLTIVCLTIIALILSIPFLITQTPEMEWLLLGFTAAVSACAVVGAILVQFNADKMAKVYRKVFNADFYLTIRLLTQMRQIVIKEAADKGRNVEEELNDVIPKAYAFLRAYLDKENINPLTLEELGIEAPPQVEDEKELFT